MEKFLDFTPDTFAAFKRKVSETERKREDRFLWSGNAVLVAYAKYVIEYVESHTHWSVRCTSKT
jgi:hypothetical protein